jgi:hypothetical protein
MIAMTNTGIVVMTAIICVTVVICWGLWLSSRYIYRELTRIRYEYNIPIENAPLVEKPAQGQAQGTASYTAETPWPIPPKETDVPTVAPPKPPVK